MPGHKRQEVFAISFGQDITEIDGFDDLHHPEDVIRAEQERAARLFGAKDSFFLVNGSTAGILAAICSQTKYGEGIILARNSHRSAYHAVYLNGLKAWYVYPQTICLRDMFSFAATDDPGFREGKKAIFAKDPIPGPVDPDLVGKAMDESGYKVVCITSPTYEGIVSDISAIAEEVHKRDGILIVDEAHGAHFSVFETIVKRHNAKFHSEHDTSEPAGTAVQG